jgi:alpha-galactosidase
MAGRFVSPGIRSQDIFNDPDYLNVDHAKYIIHEKRSHFALWSSLSAPLIISAYIPAFTAEEIEYVTNTDIIIAVDQEPLGNQAALVSQDGTWDVLTKDLDGGDRLLTVLNRGNSTGSYTVPFSRIGISSSQVPYRLKDLWTGQESHVSNEITAAPVPPHGTAVFRFSSLNTPTEIIPTGIIFNTYSLNCLTPSGKGSASWAPCDASDAQVWQTPDDETVRSFLDTFQCLTDGGSQGSITVTFCNQWLRQQSWSTR